MFCIINKFSFTWIATFSTAFICANVSAEDLYSRSPYRIVIDGGSTGSRLHIFEFVVDELSGKTDCIRRGSERSHTALSAFGRADRSLSINQTALVDHIIDVFIFAADIIPSDFHYSTDIKFAATAGMRLLEEDEQNEIYDSLYEGLMKHNMFAFRNFDREDIFTLEGEKEGFYGAVAANFLKGIVDTKLSISTDTKAGHSESPVGALDMGGSSTQIVYLPKSRCDDKDCDKSSSSNVGKITEKDFFSTSYLAYGVDKFRERLWDTWVINHQKHKGSNTPKVLQNPCAFVGYELNWKGYTLVGTGDAKKCVEEVQRLIPGDEPEKNLGRKVGGIEHPPVGGKFLAMSLYYFALDSLRELSHPSKEAHEALNLAWPNPSIQELHDALDGFCSRSWQGDLADIQHEAHVFTRAEILPHRCLESVYMITLLRDGFGFEPTSRDITFCFLVDGSEVEWSLGLALSQHAEQYKIDFEKEEPKINQTEKDVCVGDNNENKQERS